MNASLANIAPAVPLFVEEDLRQESTAARETQEIIQGYARLIIESPEVIYHAG